MFDYFICNVVTGKASVRAPSRELVERAYHYQDNYFPKRGPEQVICRFSKALGINLLNFHTFPKSLIWDGVANYARGK